MKPTKLFSLLFLAVMALTLPLSAQTFSLSGPTTVVGGQSLTMTLSCTGCTTSNLEILQTDIAVDGMTSLTCAVGAQLTAASKSIACAPVGTTGYRLLASGLNTTTISDGVLASFTGIVPPSDAGMKLTFTMTNQSGATTTGTAPTLTVSAITVTVASPFVSSVSLSPCDLNADGVVNATDLSLAINQALGIATPGASSADVDGSGTVTVKDVLRIVVAALGGACVTGP